MRTVALMAVGPHEAERHLHRALSSASRWADEILVYGDGPDRFTHALISEYADRYVRGDESEWEQGEHLVRNRLFEMADAALHDGDIVCVVDADEEFAADPATVDQTLRGLERDPYESWNVRFLHLWTPDGSMHRVDGMWQPSTGTRIYRHHPGYRVEPLGAWVSPPLPRHLIWGPRPPILDVLHWSYARPQDRPIKHDRYSRLAGHHPAHIASILTEPTLEPVP